MERLGKNKAARVDIRRKSSWQGARFCVHLEGVKPLIRVFSVCCALVLRVSLQAHGVGDEMAAAAQNFLAALSDEQRQKFEKLLLDKTKPPKQYSQPQYDFYVVMIEASKLPDKDLKEIFDDAQMKAMQRVYQQTKGMEQMLKQEGVFAE